MTRKELYEALASRIPAALSEEWDNDGMMCLPHPTRRVERVLCTLDVSDEVILYAIRKGYDLILSHHPLIFKGVSALHEEDAVARRLITLIRNDIAVFSFHTRLDAVEGGINDALCEMLGLGEVESFAGLGRVGTLPETLSFSVFAERVKAVLGVPFLNTRCVSDTVRRVAVVGGEGKDMIGAALMAGADTYLSGRLGYHAMLDATVNLLEAGHYFTERHAARLLAEMTVRVHPEAKVEIYTPNLLSVY